MSMPASQGSDAIGASATSAAGVARAFGGRWLREPLLHFMLMGAVLFALDHFLVRASGDERTIVVDAAVDAEALKIFKEARGREPIAEELYALRRAWLDNEVLYREGLALQLDKGDKAIKDRVIFKALSMVNAGLKLPPIDEVKLREWFEANRARYDQPARFDFQEAVIAGDSSDTAARALASALNAGAQGEIEAGLRVFQGRPHANIVQSYGGDFAAELEASAIGRWHAIRHGDGWRVMRLDSVTAGKPAAFESVRNTVMQDWTDSVMAEQRSAAVREMARKYTVEQTTVSP